jgi:HK97 gp10 family phage protein
MDGTVVKVEGLEHFKKQLLELTAQLRRRVLRNALSAGARLVRDEAKRNAPVLSADNRQAPYRKPGTVKNAIRVRTSKRDRREGNVGVFVNVKPAGSGARGAKSKDDPFYWRWLEFGWTPATKGVSKKQRRSENRAGVAKKIAGRKFLSNAAGKLGAALQVFEQQVGRWIDKVNVSGRTDA